MEIKREDFEKIEMRVGTIIQVKDFPEALNPSYRITIDFGTIIGIKKTAAQITKMYKKEDLIGKQIVAIVNFPLKQIANFNSECLILGSIGQENKVILLTSDFKVENGLKIG